MDGENVFCKKLILPMVNDTARGVRKKKLQRRRGLFFRNQSLHTLTVAPHIDGP